MIAGTKMSDIIVVLHNKTIDEFHEFMKRLCASKVDVKKLFDSHSLSELKLPLRVQWTTFDQHTNFKGKLAIYFVEGLPQDVLQAEWARVKDNPRLHFVDKGAKAMRYMDWSKITASNIPHSTVGWY